ncbi:MAG: hypothetical protein ACR2HJ_05490 [Fimbriimonadales bacterium]
MLTTVLVLTWILSDATFHRGVLDVFRPAVAVEMRPGFWVAMDSKRWGLLKAWKGRLESKEGSLRSVGKVLLETPNDQALWVFNDNDKKQNIEPLLVKMVLARGALSLEYRMGRPGRRDAATVREVIRPTIKSEQVVGLSRTFESKGLPKGCSLYFVMPRGLDYKMKHAFVEDYTEGLHLIGLWANQRSVVAGTFSKMISAGDEARDLFAEFERDLRTSQSASGDLIGRGRGLGPFKSTFLLQKPKSFRVIDGQINIFCNGKVQFNHLVAEKEYFKRDVSKGFGFGAPYALDAFFGFPTGATAPYFEKRTEFRMQKVDGRVCAAKAIHFESFDRDDRLVFFVDRATKQILGWDQVFGDTKMHYRFENMRFSVKVPAGAFDWTPMPGLKERSSSRYGTRRDLG